MLGRSGPVRLGHADKGAGGRGKDLKKKGHPQGKGEGDPGLWSPVPPLGKGNEGNEKGRRP